LYVYSSYSDAVISPDCTAQNSTLEKKYTEAGLTQLKKKQRIYTAKVLFNAQ